MSTSRAGTRPGPGLHRAASDAAPRATSSSATSAIAVYDAVMAIEGGYEPFAVDVDAPAGASAEAAVAAAAHRIFEHYLPAQEADDPRSGVRRLAGQHPRRAGEDGRCRRRAARRRRCSSPCARTTGSASSVPYTPPNPPIPGVWMPTAPTPPIGTYLGQMRPSAWTPPTSSGPTDHPRSRSKRWARDYNEVKEIGSRTSTTADRLSRRRQHGSGRRHRCSRRARAFREFVLDHELDVVEAARFMAMISVTYADGTHRLLRRQVRLRVLAADHRDPRR